MIDFRHVTSENFDSVIRSASEGYLPWKQGAFQSPSNAVETLESPSKRLQLCNCNLGLSGQAHVAAPLPGIL